MLDIRLLGGFALAGSDGELQAPKTRKAAFLLACLALLGGRPETRERLAAFLWSDRGDAQARGSLRQALAELRRICADALVANSQTVALSAGGFSCDATAFLAAAGADAPERLAAAAALYRGPLLEGLDAPDAGAADWLRVERERLHRAALGLLGKAVAAADRAKPHERAAFADLARRILAVDPTAEEAHRTLISLALSEGRTTEALRLYGVCSETLKRELDAEPEAATRALAERARESTPAADTGKSSPPRGDDARPAALDEGPSIVVMPFENLSGDPGQSIFVDGIVEEITGALARMRDFFVIARQTANSFKGAAHDVREVGRALGVRYVLEGAVRRSGDRVRITVSLIDAQGGTHLWSDRLDGEVADVFDFQDEIAVRVAGALHPSLRAAEIERARRKRPESLAAYDRVMRAYPCLWAHTGEGNREAIALLGEALDESPEYGLAAALLAWCHAQQATYLWSDNPAEDRRQAVALCKRAARRTDDDATALAAIGAAYSLATDDFDLAERFVQRSLAIDPNNAWGWARGGWVCHYAGDMDLALERFTRAHRLSPLDPLDFNVSFGMAASHLAKGNYRAATKLVEEGLRAKPDLIWPYRLLAVSAALEGDLDKARQAIARLLDAHPGMTIERMMDAIPRGVLGRKDFYWEGLRKAGLPEK